MRKMIACLLTAVHLFAVCAGEEENLLYMINVGKGDAVLVFCGEDVYLVDAGKSGAYDAVDAALRRFDILHLKGVFLTHTDKDHAGGLKKLVKSGRKVDTWYASAYYDCEYADHPMVKALKKQNAQITFLKAGDTVDGVFRVIAPFEQANDEDDNSLVMLYEHAGIRILLCGDMETEEEREVLDAGLPECDVFKVPNHADDDACALMDPELLKASVALISTDPEEKPGTPDGLLLWRLEEAGMKVYCTCDTANGIRVFLKDGKLTVQTD